MNLLLLLLALAPELQVVTAATVPVPTTSLVFGWDPMPGCDRYLFCYGTATRGEAVDARSRTTATVEGLTNSVWWIGVAGVSNNTIVRQTQVLLVQLPAKRLRKYRATDFEGKEFWSQTFTNTPPGDQGKAKLSVVEELDYGP